MWTCFEEHVFFWWLICRDQWDSCMLHKWSHFQIKHHHRLRVPTSTEWWCYHHIWCDPSLWFQLLGRGYNCKPQPPRPSWQLETKLEMEQSRVHTHNERCLSIRSRLFWMCPWSSRCVLQGPWLHQCVELSKKTNHHWSPTHKVQWFRPWQNPFLLQEWYLASTINWP